MKIEKSRRVVESRPVCLDLNMYSNKYTNSTGGYLFQNCRLFYSFSGFEILQREGQSRSQSMPVRGLCSGMPLHNPRTGILWERD